MKKVLRAITIITMFALIPASLYLCLVVHFLETGFIGVCAFQALLLLLVLNKPGKLTDEEFETIKSHTSLGYDALKDISIMPELAVGAQAHHERPDGRGYPNHLKDGEIPRVAQIIAVADWFDAMYSNCPYRNRMNFDKVISIIKEVSGTQLTTDVVEAFLRLVEKCEFRDPNDQGGGSTENIENIRKA